MVFRKIYIYLSEPQKRQVRHEMKLKASLAMIDGYGLCVCHGVEHTCESLPYKEPKNREEIIQDFINIESVTDVMKCANELGWLTHESIKQRIEEAKPITPTKRDVILALPWQLKRSEKESLESCIQTWGFVSAKDGGTWQFSPLPEPRNSPYNIVRFGSYIFGFEPVLDWVRASQDLRITCLILCRKMGIDPFEGDFITLDEKNVCLLNTTNKEKSTLANFYYELAKAARLSPGGLIESSNIHSFHEFLNDQPNEIDALAAINLMLPKYRKELHLGNKEYPLVEPPNNYRVEESCVLQNIWKDITNGFLSKKIGVCQKCGRITYGSLRSKKYCSKSHENKDVIVKPALSRIRLV